MQECSLYFNITLLLITVIITITSKENNEYTIFKMAGTVDKQNKKSKKNKNNNNNNNKKLNNVSAHHLHIFSCCQNDHWL